MSALVLTADKIRRFDILIHGVVAKHSSKDGIVVMEYENGQTQAFNTSDTLLVIRNG